MSVNITEYPFVKVLDEFGRHSTRTSKIIPYLIEKYGVCYWCGTKVRHYPVLNNQPLLTPDAATIDHLKSRFFRKKGEIVPKVLACYLCNWNRHIEEEKKYATKHREIKSAPHLNVH